MHNKLCRGIVAKSIRVTQGGQIHVSRRSFERISKMSVSISFTVHCLPSLGNISSVLAAPWPQRSWALCWRDHSRELCPGRRGEGPAWVGTGVLLWKVFAALTRVPC